MYFRHSSTVPLQVMRFSCPPEAFPGQLASTTPLIRPHSSMPSAYFPKPFRMIFLREPYPLTPMESHSYEKHGGGGGTCFRNSPRPSASPTRHFTHKLDIPESPQPQFPQSFAHSFRHTPGWGSPLPPPPQVLLCLRASEPPRTILITSSASAPRATCFPLWGSTAQELCHDTF